MNAPLWMSSARRRPVAAVSIVLITVLTVLAAALGPIMLRAVEQSALAESLASAPTGTNDAVLIANSSTDLAIRDAIGAASSIATSLTPPLYGSPSTLAESSTLAWRTSVQAPISHRVRAIAAPDDCAQFAVVTGRCPGSPSEVAVPISDLTAKATTVGATIVVGFFANRYTVVGGYDPGRSSAQTIATTDPSAATADATTGDDLLMTLDGVSVLKVNTRVSVRVPLMTGRLKLDQIPGARAALARTNAAILTQNTIVVLSTGLTDRLDSFAADERAAEALVLVVVVQALALAWLSAIVVVAIVARARSREWALGRLRGVRRVPWLLSVFAEPLILLVIGTVTGLALGAVLAQVASDRWLRSGTGIEPFRAPVLIAAGLAVGGLVAAFIVGSVRSARAPLASLLNEGAEPARISRFALVGQVLVLGLAAASVYQLRAASDLSASNARLALAAPALLAAALGILAIGTAARIVRSRTRRPARGVLGVLIIRPLARVPSALQRNMVVAIVVALTVFVTQLAALSVLNQHHRADGIMGTDRVLDVRVPSGLNLRDAVRQADPGGTYAMAAIEKRAAGDGGTGRILAVDTARMASVMKWSPSWGTGLSAADVAVRLTPSRPASIAITGATARIQLTGVTLTPLDTGTASPAPALGMIVSNGASWIHVGFGPLTSGSKTYTGALDESYQDGPTQTCAKGCSIVRFYLDNSGDQNQTTYSAQFTVASLSTDVQPTSQFASILQDGTRWQPWVTGADLAGNGVLATAAGTASGLHITASDPTGRSTLGVSSAAAPDPLPVVIATGVQADPVLGSNGTRVGTDLGGQRVDIQPVAPSAYLPRTQRDGVLTDMNYMSLLSDPDPSHDNGQREVWLRNGAPSSIVAALTKAGIVVTATETLSDERHTLSLEATARAATTNLIVIAVAGLIGIAVIAATQLIDADRRRTLWTVAHSSRISRARMTRLVIAEIAGPAVLGAVIGAITGVIAIWLAGLRLPVFTAGSISPPLDISVRWAVAGGVLGGSIVVILLVAGLVAGVEATRDRSQR